MRTSTRQMVTAALFLAVGILFPYLLGHALGGQALGQTLLPMHIPVLLGGLFLSWPWAVAVGVLVPVLSSLLTGMPQVAPMPMLQLMVVELAVYALVVSLLRGVVARQGRWYSPLIALIPAMVAGRVAVGLAAAVLLYGFGIQIPNATPWAYVYGATLSGLPGLVLQVVLVPALYALLKRVRKPRGN